MDCDQEFDIVFIDVGSRPFTPDIDRAAVERTKLMNEQARQEEQAKQEMWQAVGFVTALVLIIFLFRKLGDVWKRWNSPARVAARRQAAEAERERRATEVSERKRRVAERDQERRERAADEARVRQEREDRRTAIPRLAAWFEEQKAEIERAVPNGPERDTLLLSLWGRYDQLLKELLEEMRP